MAFYWDVTGECVIFIFLLLLFCECNANNAQTKVQFCFCCAFHFLHFKAIISLDANKTKALSMRNQLPHAEYFSQYDRAGGATCNNSRKQPREFRTELRKTGWSQVTVTTAGEGRSSGEYLRRVIVGMKVHVISWKQDTAETWKIGLKLHFFFSLFSFCLCYIGTPMYASRKVGNDDF